jgi:hypothetical protein
VHAACPSASGGDGGRTEHPDGAVTPGCLRAVNLAVGHAGASGPVSELLDVERAALGAGPGSGRGD